MNRVSNVKNKDAQIREFETRDLGYDIAKSKASVVIHPKMRQKPTSILLEPSIIQKLRSKAEKRGIGYQTMLKIIVYEHVNEY